MLYTVQHNTSLNATMQGLPDQELAHLTTELYANDHAGVTAQILAAMVPQLSAANLVRLASAFGTAPVQAELGLAPSAVQAAYWATPASTPLMMSVNWYAKNNYAMMAPQPAYDVYLNFHLQNSAQTQLTATHNSQLFFKSKGLVEVGIVAGVVAMAQVTDPNLRNDTITLANTIWQNMQASIPSFEIPTIMVGPMGAGGGGATISDGSGGSDKVDDSDYGVECDNSGNCG
jgi:hypothetical protein